MLQSRWRVVGLSLAAALASAGLLNLTYFPAGQGWLGWFALVPGLVLVRADLQPRDRYLIAWIAAWMFFLPALRWMRVAHEAMFYSWIALSLACSWFVPPAIGLIRRLDQHGWPLTLSVPLVWTALEFVRTHIFGGFPWYLLGQSQHDFLPIIQIADLGGVPIVTFLVAAVNGLMAEVLFRMLNLKARPAPPSPHPQSAFRARLLPQIVAVAVAFAATLTYGAWRLSQGPFADGPIVALLQTSLEQEIRNARMENSDGELGPVQDLRVQRKQLTVQALRTPPFPDILVLPETTFEAEIKVRSNPVPSESEYAKWASDIGIQDDYLAQVARYSQTSLLLGTNVETYSAGGAIDRYNSAVLVSRSGKVLGRYDKTHLVPFGEYVPLKDAIPVLKNLAPYDQGITMLTPGESFPRLTLPVGNKSYTFGCMICYEDSYAALARQYMTGPDQPVNFLVNQSNDAWFRCTQEHEEHLAVSRFRAIECRRALVRAVNMGISAIIDGNGRIVKLPAETWAESKGRMAVVGGPVPIDPRTSLYAQTGDVLPWLCWIGIVGLGWLRRKPAE